MRRGRPARSGAASLQGWQSLARHTAPLRAPCRPATELPRALAPDPSGLQASHLPGRPTRPAPAGPPGSAPLPGPCGPFPKSYLAQIPRPFNIRRFDRGSPPLVWRDRPVGRGARYRAPSDGVGTDRRADRVVVEAAGAQGRGQGPSHPPRQPQADSGTPAKPRPGTATPPRPEGATRGPPAFPPPSTRDQLSASRRFSRMWHTRPLAAKTSGGRAAACSCSLRSSSRSARRPSIWRSISSIFLSTTRNT